MPHAAKTSAASSSSLKGLGACRLSYVNGPPGIFIPKPKRRERRFRNAVSNGMELSRTPGGVWVLFESGMTRGGWVRVHVAVGWFANMQGTTQGQAQASFFGAPQFSCIRSADLGVR